MQDDTTFYLIAVIVPVLFVLVGAGVRFAIKRKKDPELFYFGVELVLAGMAACIIHLITPHKEAAEGAPRAGVLTTPQNATMIVKLRAAADHVMGSVASMSYSGRAGVAMLFLVLALVVIIVMHVAHDMKPRPTSTKERISEAFWLAVIANVIGGCAMVYMEQLLR